MDIREAAQKYLVNQIAANETAIAVLGEKKDWVSENEWNVFPLSLEPEPFGDAVVDTMEKVRL